MITQEEIIAIGTLTRTHGKQGEVQCLMSNSLWDEADATFLILRIQNIFVPFRVLDWRGKGSDSLIFQLDGIDSESKALPLLGNDAFMLRSDVCSEQESEDMLTWQDLVGYDTFASDQHPMGKITYVDESTINTLATTDQNRMLPLHEDLILVLDTKQKILQLNIPSEL